MSDTMKKKSENIEGRFYTYNDMVAVVDMILQRPDLILDACQNENTVYDAEDLVGYALEDNDLLISDQITDERIEQLTESVVGYQSRNTRAIQLLEQAASAIEGEPMMIISENMYRQELQSAYAIPMVRQLGEGVREELIEKINARGMEYAESILDLHRRMTNASREALINYKQ